MKSTALTKIHQNLEAKMASFASKEDNVIKNAPHIIKMIVTDDWKHSYSTKKAVFPLKWVQANKFWPAVAKIDNALGDRNLICTCFSTAE